MTILRQPRLPQIWPNVRRLFSIVFICIVLTKIKYTFMVLTLGIVTIQYWIPQKENKL